ncbi:MAG: hypothetical protein ACYTBS_02905 [Planctomycetota bacterium]|jgi:hypothetical protein
MAVMLRWSAIVLVLSQAVASITYAKLPDITAAELIEAVKHGDSLLRNVDCNYTVDEQLNKAIHRQSRRPLKRKLEIHWRKEGTKDYVDVTCYDGRLFSGKSFRFVMAHNDKIRMQWQPNEKLGYVSEKPQKDAWPIPFDFCVTLKKRGKMLGQALEESRIETLEDARWENRECYYVEAVQPDQGRAKVWIDPKAGWRARRIRYWGPGGSIWYEASANLKDCGNGIWFPAEGVFTLYGNDRATGKRVGSAESRLKLKQVKVNADLSTKDFEIQYPHGTRVHVVAHEASYIAGVTSLGGFGEEALNRMAGKPLPNLEEYGIAPDPNHTKDKVILVCFWDVNQRPSRHCISQVAGRAEQLRKRGVIVVAVQAAKVDEDKLSKWVKNSNIPIPVGAIATDHEKIRFTLGVRSLPWLILTNERHIVTAEGFSMAELDERLNSNSNF